MRRCGDKPVRCILRISCSCSLPTREARTRQTETLASAHSVRDRRAVHFHSRAIPVLATLCLLAVVCGQVFGVDRAYLCICSGVPVETVAVHCAEASEPGHKHEDDSCPARHAEVKHRLQLVRPAQIAAPMVHAVPVAVLPELDVLNVEAARHRAARSELDAGARPAVAVARAVVLLI